MRRTYALPLLEQVQYLYSNEITDYPARVINVSKKKDEVVEVL